eukprot:5424093-Pleurochrysis_carterae.AAC.2
MYVSFVEEGSKPAPKLMMIESNPTADAWSADARTPAELALSSDDTPPRERVALLDFGIEECDVGGEKALGGMWEHRLPRAERVLQLQQQRSRAVVSVQRLVVLIVFVVGV